MRDESMGTFNDRIMSERRDKMSINPSDKAEKPNTVSMKRERERNYYNCLNKKMQFLFIFVGKNQIL